MADKVFVFGAGASVTTGTPLMKDFIDVAEDLWRRHPGAVSKDDFELVFELIQDRLPTLHAKSVVDLANIESVFSLIEMGRLLGRLPATPANEIPRAANAIRRILTDTVELTCKFNVDRKGVWSPPTEYSRFVDKLFPSDRSPAPDSYAFLTFNYDVALDFALRYRGIPTDYAFTDELGAGVPVLKLHGSLNWRVCADCGHLSSLDVLTAVKAFSNARARGATSDAMPLRVSRVLGEITPQCGHANDDVEPAIVPPTWNKTQYHLAFGPVWRRAAAEIAQAREITVIGYSLPKSDAFFRDLLALGLAGRTRLRKLTVVDPSPLVPKRFQRLLGPEIRRGFDPRQSTFADYVVDGPQPRVRSL